MWNDLRRRILQFQATPPQGPELQDLLRDIQTQLDDFDLYDPPVDQEGHVGDWNRIRSGGIYVLSLRPDDVDVEDIFLSLGNLCRFLGHCRHFYSVLHHSILVARLLGDPEVTPDSLLGGVPRPVIGLHGLFHDSTEAYSADIPSPLKRYLPGYRRLETQIARAIGEKLGLPYLHDLPACVKRADKIALVLEAEELSWNPEEWNLPLRDEVLSSPYRKYYERAIRNWVKFHKEEGDERNMIECARSLMRSLQEGCGESGIGSLMPG